MTAYECSVESHEKVRWCCAVTINSARGGYNATCNAEKALDAALHKADPDIAAAFDWAFRRCIAQQRNVRVVLSDKFCTSRACLNGLHASTCTPSDGCDNFVLLRCLGTRAAYECIYKMTPQRALVAKLERGSCTSLADFTATVSALMPQPKSAAASRCSDTAQQLDCCPSTVRTSDEPPHRRGTLALDDELVAVTAAAEATTSSASKTSAPTHRFTVYGNGCNPSAAPFTPKGLDPVDEEICRRTTSRSPVGVRAEPDGLSASSTPKAAPKLTLDGPPRALSTEEQRWLLACLQHNTKS